MASTGSKQMATGSGARREIVIPTSRGEKADFDSLPHRGSHILGFYETKYSIDNEWKNWVSSRVLFGSSQYGWQSKLAAGRRFSEGFRNNGAELIAFTTFGSKENRCGRDIGYPMAPAQIRTGATNAYGSYAECLTSNRSLG